MKNKTTPIEIKNSELKNVYRASGTGEVITPVFGIVNYPIPTQTISGAVRMKLISNRKELGSVISDYIEARREIASLFYKKKKSGEFHKDKAGGFILLPNKTTEDFKAAVKELDESSSTVNLRLLTEDEFNSLRMSDETPLFITDSELNPLLNETNPEQKK